MQNQSIPLVSIITPSFNQGQFIEETILSVLNQTYKNIQYIVVDGGSTDHTMEVVNKYCDRIDIIIHEKDKGQTDAINKGFKLAKGELVGWINSDDILYPDCVEKIVELYKDKPDGAVYYSSRYVLIDIHSNIIKEKCIIIQSKPHLLNKKYSIIQQGSFYKLSLVRRIGFLDENLHYCMDLDLWLRLLNVGEMYTFADKPLAAFRFDGNTKTMNAGYKFFREIRKTLIKHGAKYLSPNIKRLVYYQFKDYIKRAIRYKKG